MKLFFRLSFLYFAFAFALSTALRGGDLTHFETALALLRGTAIGYPLATAVFLGVFVGGYAISGRSAAVLRDVGYAVGGTCFLKLGYTLFKTSMTLMVPFYADTFFADLDRLLHFGHDPWVLLHGIGAWVPAGLADAVYVRSWFIIAFGFPLLLAATDPDRGRQNRFLILNGVAWIGIGNALALATMSAGPVYHDRLLGGVRFADLTDALAASGVSTALTGAIQEHLWFGYETHAAALGSGISAFPSVHVAMSAVFALYVAERWRFLAWPAFAYLAAIQFLSVWLGWHYAVDGYASIAVIGGAYLLLVRRERARSASISPAAVTSRSD